MRKNGTYAALKICIVSFFPDLKRNNRYKTIEFPTYLIKEMSKTSPTKYMSTKPIAMKPKTSLKILSLIHI